MNLNEVFIFFVSYQETRACPWRDLEVFVLKNLVNELVDGF